MPPGAAFVVMPATLVRREYITLRFDCPGLQQNFPVRFACGMRKGRWHKNNIGTGVTQSLILFRETQIKTNRQADITDGGFDIDDVTARREGIRFPVASLCITYVDIK